MKKSEIYKFAQCAVIDTPHLNAPAKLEVLHELMEEEKLALFCEKRDEKKEEEVEQNG